MLKAIPGFAHYEIDESGRVFSCFFEKKRELAQQKPKWNPISKSWGYFQVKIGGKYKAVHRLVLQTFIGPCPDGMEARHLDGNKYNNHLSNLRWGTRQQNSGDDKVRVGVSNRGERNGRGRLKCQEIDLIMKLIKNGWSDHVIAPMFRVSNKHSNCIRNGTKWGWYTRMGS